MNNFARNDNNYVKAIERATGIRFRSSEEALAFFTDRYVPTAVPGDGSRYPYLQTHTLSGNSSEPLSQRALREYTNNEIDDNEFGSGNFRFSFGYFQVYIDIGTSTFTYNDGDTEYDDSTAEGANTPYNNITVPNLYFFPAGCEVVGSEGVLENLIAITPMRLFAYYVFGNVDDGYADHLFVPYDHQYYFGKLMNRSNSVPLSEAWLIKPDGLVDTVSFNETTPQNWTGDMLFTHLFFNSNSASSVTNDWQFNGVLFTAKNIDEYNSSPEPVVFTPIIP